MAKNIKTHLYCYDDHRGFAEDVRKRFSDQSRYSVDVFLTKIELTEQLSIESKYKYCKVVILGIHDTKEQVEMIDHLAIDIKKIDKATGLIVLCPPDKMELVRKTIKFNIDAYIPKNENSVLRIHNTVKKLISEHNISVFRRKSNVSLLILLGFLFLAFILLTVAFFKLPHYF